MAETQAPEKQETQALEKQIEEIRDQERSFGWRNSAAGYFFATAAVAGSVSASLFAAFGASKRLIGILAAIPAAVAAVTRVFPFEVRARAHWIKEYKLHGLLLKLRFEGVDSKAVSEEFRKIESGTFDGWQLLGDTLDGGRKNTG